MIVASVPVLDCIEHQLKSKSAHFLLEKMKKSGFGQQPRAQKRTCGRTIRDFSEIFYYRPGRGLRNFGVQKMSDLRAGPLPKGLNAGSQMTGLAAAV